MKNSTSEYMHQLLAESLYRGFKGARPSQEEATVLAIHSVRWFHELLLRLSIQSCIDEVDPIVGPFEQNERLLPNSDACEVQVLHPSDEALWDALCEGRLVLRIEGSQVNASVEPRPPSQLVH